MEHEGVRTMRDDGMGRRLTRRLAMVVLAATMSTGGAVLFGSAAASAHEPGTNGCTLSPDSGYSPSYYNFHDACDRHDLCYVNKPFGNTSAGRKACDDAFRADMRAWCANYYRAWWQAPFRSNCYATAEVYYSAVRTFGGAFF